MYIHVFTITYVHIHTHISILYLKLMLQNHLLFFMNAWFFEVRPLRRRPAAALRQLRLQQLRLEPHRRRRPGATPVANGGEITTQRMVKPW